MSEDKVDGGTLFVSLLIGLAAGAAAFWIWWMNNQSECRRETRCLPIGEDWRLRYAGPYQSVNGLGRVLSVEAELVFSSGDPVPISVEPFDNEHWGPTLEVTDLSVKGVSVTDYTSLAKTRMAFAIPDRDDWIERKGTLRFTSEIQFPAVEEGGDIVSRSFGSDFTFKDEVREISDQFPIVLKPAGFNPYKKIASFWFWIASGVSGLFLLGFIGNLLPDD